MQVLQALPQLQVLPKLQDRPQLPPFLSIPAADAAKITLNPNDCHRLGAFPYFCENVSGFFIRIKMDKGTQHVWARVVAGVTADRLASYGLLGAIGGSETSTPLMFSMPSEEEEQDARKNINLSANPDVAAWLDLPNFWRRRLVEEPIYEWREKRFETHLICEHPFAAVLNRAAEQSPAAGGMDEEADLVTPSPPAPTAANATFLVSFRQVAKEFAPTQEEIDAYCAQFVPIEDKKPEEIAQLTADDTAYDAEKTIAAITNGLSAAPLASSSSNLFATAVQSDPLAYVPQEFKKAFMTTPAQSEKEAESERLEARIKERVSKSKSQVRGGGGDQSAAMLLPPATSSAFDQALPHASIASAAMNKWGQFFTKNVIHKALNKEDSSKVISANTRLSNVAGNVVIRGAVMYNLNLSRASQIELARRSVEHAHSQSVKAAQKVLSRQALSQTDIQQSDDNAASSLAPTPLMMQATQLGSASQNMAEDSTGLEPLSSPSVGYALDGSLSGATSNNNALDVNTLLQAALGSGASASQIGELRDTLLYSSSASPNPLRAPSSTLSSALAPQASMMLLLTAEERRALERDDAQFNSYLNNEARRKDLDVLAAVTTRNTKINVALRLQGYKLMAIRDQEREAHDDTSQRMWVTDAEARKQEAEEYAKMKAAEAEKAGEKGGKKEDGKKETKGPRYLTDEEEMALLASEAKRVNDTISERQGSTLLSRSSGSLQRGSSSGSAAMMGDADDLDDLLQLSQNASLRRNGNSATSNTTLVRASSILTPKERQAVSQSLGRVPIVLTAGAKRDREE